MQRLRRSRLNAESLHRYSFPNGDCQLIQKMHILPSKPKNTIFAENTKRYA